MLDEKSREIGRLLLILDLGLVALVFLVSFWLREFFLGAGEADFHSHLSVLPILMLFFGFSMAHFGVYHGLTTISIYSYGWAVIRALAITLALLTTFLFLLKIQSTSRAVIIIFVVLTFLTLVGVRSAISWWYFHKSVEKKENYLKILIIGTGNRAIRLAKALPEFSEWGIDIVGHLDPDPSKIGMKVLDSEVIGDVDNISSILKNTVIDEVFLAIPRTMIEDVDMIVSACEEEGVKFRMMADLFDFKVARMRLVKLAGIPLLTLEPVAQDETKLLVKRLSDILFSLILLPVLLPLMGIIAIAIKLDSKGPVFFIQERVGRHKRVFGMYKFRSMMEGSDKKLKELEHLNEAEGPIFKIADDPRVTRVGRFLRRTSLDEIPQIFNVLRGQMSLVGPRPMSVRDVDLFDKGIQRKRFSVRPGITCLWQISGRSNLPFAKWLELDLEYIENWSLWLDIKILIKTIPVVLRGTGAV